MHSERLAALRAFAVAAYADPTLELSPASADASFRSYWRVRTRGATRIVMNAPPDREDIGPWLDVGARLRAAGVHAPEVHAVDRAQGFVAMEDLGDHLYLPALDETRVDALYGEALAALARMQADVDCAGLPDYDRARLAAEMDLMPTWFCTRHLGLEPGCAGWELIEDACTRLAACALEQPVAFVHRDYHSRNLLVLPTGGPGVIDFQDAVRGPVTYDLVSLLRDCYITWPRARVRAWAEGHRRTLVAAGLVDADAARFARWFDFMGLQRHIKVLGIFCRLWYRDGKAGYLGDLPRVHAYVVAVASEYPELAAFAGWLQRVVGNRDLTVPRDATADTGR